MIKFSFFLTAATSIINCYCWCCACCSNWCLPLCVLCDELSLTTHVVMLENVWKIMCRRHNNFTLVLIFFRREMKKEGEAIQSAREKNIINLYSVCVSLYSLKISGWYVQNWVNEWANGQRSEWVKLWRRERENERHMQRSRIVPALHKKAESLRAHVMWFSV